MASARLPENRRESQQCPAEASKFTQTMDTVVSLPRPFPSRWNPGGQPNRNLKALKYAFSLVSNWYKKI